MTLDTTTLDLAVVDTRHSPVDIISLASLAKLYPRKPRSARTAILKLAADPRWAEAATYPVESDDGETILRPSVRFARPCAIAWTNLSSGARIVARGIDSEVVEGWSFDAQARRIRPMQETVLRAGYRKDPKTGRKNWVRLEEEEYRAQLYKVAAILERKCLLDALPDALIVDVMNACEATLERESARLLAENDVHELVTIRSALREIGADDEQVERWLGHPLTTLDAREHSAISAIIRSVRAGDSRLSQHFGYVEPETFGDEQAPAAPPTEPRVLVAPPLPGADVAPLAQPTNTAPTISDAHWKRK